MAKGSGLYARDIDIGKPKISSDVSVANFSEVTTELETVVDKLEEAIEEVKKTRVASELIIGEEV